jgi:hypothetical protein
LVYDLTAIDTAAPLLKTRHRSKDGLHFSLFAMAPLRVAGGLNFWPSLKWLKISQITA